MVRILKNGRNWHKYTVKNITSLSNIQGVTVQEDCVSLYMKVRPL